MASLKPLFILCCLLLLFGFNLIAQKNLAQKLG
ncbi:MAG: hypothetical protein ACI8VT_002655, partial [Saprospiraceae bacterium]